MPVRPLKRLYKEVTMISCTAISPNDAHTIGIKYHKLCWATHVTHVLRKPTDAPEFHRQYKASEVAAEIEFISMLQGILLEGNVPSMASLQEAYITILLANDVPNPTCDRKKLKNLIKREIPDVEFHRSKQVNESDTLSIKTIRDTAIHMMEADVQADLAENMMTLYNAARVLRSTIKNADNWTFSGSLTDMTEKQMPRELYSFFRWVLQGPNTTLSSDQKSTQVNKHAVSLAQSTMAMFLSDRQVNNRKSQILIFNREMPQQLAVGLAMRQAHRSKKMINLLHGFGASVSYNRLLRVEAQLAKAVTERMLLNENVYLPPDVVKGRHIYFAVDNIDFAERYSRWEAHPACNCYGDLPAA